MNTKKRGTTENIKLFAKLLPKMYMGERVTCPYCGEELTYKLYKFDINDTCGSGDAKCKKCGAGEHYCRLCYPDYAKVEIIRT